MAYTQKQVAAVAATMKWYKHWWGKGLIGFLCLVLISLGWFIYLYIDVTRSMLNGEYDARTFPVQEAPPYQMERFISGTEPLLGSADAPIQVVEFGDFLCPICQRSFSVMRELSAKYPDRIAIYWKYFPIVDETSVDFAKAAECAHQQNLFWPFHDRLFLGQGNLAVGDLQRVAVQSGLNLSLYQSCLNDPKTLAVVQRDFAAAELLEATGTPTFLVDGYKISGFIPADVWDDILSKLE